MPVELRLLGPIEALIGDEIVTLGGRKQLAVLARLAIAPGSAVSTAALIDAVWGDTAPDTAAATLSAYMSRLRKSLGSDVVQRGPHGYQLAVDDIQTDVSEFECLLETAESEELDPAERAKLLKEAVDIWRGPFLGEMASEPWAQPDARRLGELREAAIEQRIATMLDAGSSTELIPELELQLTRSPLREHLWEFLMLALYRSGRQADALRAYRRASTTLGEELGIEPGEQLRRLEESILLQHPELAGTGHEQDELEVPNNLPVGLSRPVGRTTESVELVQRLGDHRLVTVTGAGGVGKTTIVADVARKAVAGAPDGVWWVDLALVPRSDRVEAAFASALGAEVGAHVTTLDAVIKRLADGESLIIVDNCEHVMEGARDTVQAVLDASPNVSMLATSRERLGIDGETVLQLEPLVLPESLDDIDDNPAVELFVQRAAERSRGFRLSAALRSDVVDIVRLVDGIPLAIEIAAAQLPLFTLPQILASMRARFLELEIAGRVPRQTTMSAAIDWSWHRLDEREGETFARLAAFAGSFDAEAAGLVVGRDVEDDLGALCSKSLLVGPLPSPDGRARFRFLEPIKHYARPRGLDDQRSALAHARAYVTLAEREVEHLHGALQADAFARLSADSAEVLDALGWLAEQPDQQPLLSRLAEAVWYPLFQAGSGRVIQPVLEQLSVAASVSPAARARHLAAASLVSTEVEPQRTIEIAGEALGLALDIPPEDSAWVCLLAGDALTSAGEYLASREPLERAIKHFEDTAVDWAAGWGNLRLVRALALAGDFPSADEILPIAEAQLRRADDLQMIAYTRLVVGNRERMLGRFQQGFAAASDARDRFVALGQEQVADECRFLAIRALVNLGRWETAIEDALGFVELTEAARRQTSEAGARLLLGQALAGAEQIDEAREVFSALERDAESLGAGDLALAASVDMVSLALLGGDIDEARGRLGSVTVLHGSESPWTVATVCIAEARVAFAANRLADAANAATEALDVGPREMHIHTAIAAHAILGRVGVDEADHLAAIDEMAAEFDVGLDPLTSRDIELLMARREERL